MTDAKFCGCGLAMKNEIMCQCDLRGPWVTIDRYKPKTQKKPANKGLIKVLEKTIQEQSSLITKMGEQIAIIKDCVEPLISRSGAEEPRITDGCKAEEKKMPIDELSTWDLCERVRLAVRRKGSLTKARQTDPRIEILVRHLDKRRNLTAANGIETILSEYKFLPKPSARAMRLVDTSAMSPLRWVRY